MNLYSYVTNSPTNWIDPDGEEAVEYIIGGITIAIAIASLIKVADRYAGFLKGLFNGRQPSNNDLINAGMDGFMPPGVPDFQPEPDNPKPEDPTPDPNDDNQDSEEDGENKDNENTGFCAIK